MGILKTGEGDRKNRKGNKGCGDEGEQSKTI